MWWACIRIRRNGQWCSAWMRRARFRRWIGHSRDCRSKKGVAGQATSADEMPTLSWTRPTMRLRLWSTRLQAQRNDDLFAALDALQGKVVGECHQRHRHHEFPRFLRRLDKEFPGKVPLKVGEWLKRHPRFVPHFVPTSSSWLNLVERWFGHLDSKAIRRGVFLSVADLQASIGASSPGTAIRNPWKN